MTALEALRAKKRSGAELTAIEQVILDAFYKSVIDPDQIELANQAANELADMIERLKEHYPR